MQQMVTSLDMLLSGSPTHSHRVGQLVIILWLSHKFSGLLRVSRKTYHSLKKRKVKFLQENSLVRS